MVIKSAEVAQANIISLKDIIEQHKRYKEALTKIARGKEGYTWKETALLYEQIARQTVKNGGA